jgi:hypothetical protein
MPKKSFENYLICGLYQLIMEIFIQIEPIQL